MSHLDPVSRPCLRGTVDYFPFRDTPAFNLLERHLRTDLKEPLKILSLGSGDLCNVLNTIHMLPRETDINFHLNDSNPSVTARNILILELITSPTGFNHDDENDINFIWDLWYNFKWDLSTKERFLDLLDEVEKAGNKWEVNFLSPDSVEDVKGIWHLWRETVCITSSAEAIAKAQEDRKDCLKRGVEERLGKRYPDFESAARMITRRVVSFLGPEKWLNSSVKDLEIPFISAILEFFRRGNIRRNSENFQPVCINPTLLNPFSHKWDFSFGATPFHAFYPIPPEIFAENLDFLKFCCSVLTERVRSFRKVYLQNSVRLLFSVEDPVKFCWDKRSESYDIIDTSSLSDDLGLANVLLLSGPLLRDVYSVLYTETMHPKRETRKKYLSDVLAIPESLFPTFLGLRLMDLVSCGYWTPWTGVGRPSFVFRWSKTPFSSPRPRLDWPRCKDLQTALQTLQNLCMNKENPQKNQQTAAYTPLTFAMIWLSMTSRFDLVDMDVVQAFEKFEPAAELSLEKATLVQRLGQNRLRAFSIEGIPLTEDFVCVDQIADLKCRPRLVLSRGRRGKSCRANFIDTVNVDICVENNTASLKLSFLLPEDFRLVFRPVSAQLFDKLTGKALTRPINFQEFTGQDFTGGILQVPRVDSKPLELPEPFKLVEFTENEGNFILVFDFAGKQKDINRSQHRLVNTRVRPCSVGHGVSFYTGLKACPVLNFYFTFPMNCSLAIDTNLRYKLEFNKVCDEAWPEDFEFSPKNGAKIQPDRLQSWSQLCGEDIVPLHLDKQNQSFGEFGATGFVMMTMVNPRIFLTKIVGQILENANDGVHYLRINSREMFDADPGLFIRIHQPLIRYTKEGTPLVCVTVYDFKARDELKAAGLLNSRKTNADYKRIIEDPRATNQSTGAVVCLSYLNPHIEMLRILLYRNSLLIEPCEEQHREVPVGPEEPWIVSFVSPVYADNKAEATIPLEQTLRIYCPFPDEENITSKKSCSNCGTRFGAMEICPRCKNAFYCCSKCKSEYSPTHDKRCRGSH